jgi:hypothetical protein
MSEFEVGDWWWGIPDVSVTVACGGAEHALLWREGALVAPDHDLSAERALVAMGGQAPYCVEVLDAWQHAGPDPYLLSVWDGQPVRSTVTLWSSTAVGAMPFVVPASSRGNAEWIDLQRRRSLLQTVPSDLYDRLALAVAAALCAGERHSNLGGLKRWAPADLLPAISTRAVPLVHRSIGSWRGATDAWKPPIVECEIAGRDDGPTVEGLVERRGGWVTVVLDPSWLVEVWGRGLALVEGCFVMSAARAHHDAFVDSVVVRWERVAAGGLEPVTAAAVLTASPGGWALRWT